MTAFVALADLRPAPAPRGQGGCRSSACGSSQASGDLPPEVWAKVKDHPCYSEEAHHFFARMHVAVAPGCNIQCNYCNRKFDCANESRPGVVSERLTPEQALRKVIAVANRVPQLSVLGIAGPGDALHDHHRTFETFRLVSEKLPDIKLCLSTNGLALPEHVEAIAALNVDHVTITINMVDPRVGEAIYPWVYFDRRRWSGRDASKILHERQMLGLEMLASRGILVKVNSVMIPGVNDAHLTEVNAEVKKRGAFLHNVMPLISDPAHGTYFGLAGQRGPTPTELKALQDDLGGGAKLMRHCRQCRADAVGLLGEDRGHEFDLASLPATIDVDPSARRAYRSVVEAERADRAAAVAAATEGLRETTPVTPVRLVAVCTKGGGRVNQHFGHATEFQVYEVDGRGVRFSGLRRADNYCRGGWGEDDNLEAIVEALAGVDAVLCAKVGGCPKDRLAEAGIAVVDAYAQDYIETAAAAWYAASSGVRKAALCA
ncbi:MAG: nitrogenase cofactor biosynthesis protein NifB [Magnetospirillum sp. WYHS-4]